MEKKKLSLPIILLLLFVYQFYASISVATKFTSRHVFLSSYYCLGLFVVFLMMGVYAILWQQVLKRVDLSLAYMFKGSGLIFLLILCSTVLNEPITWQNLLGSVFIITGIVLFAKS
jgi:drug/metabolite transporter (DMT)-like permease